MNKIKDMTLRKVESYYAQDVEEGLDVKLYNAEDIWFMASTAGDTVFTIMLSEDNNEISLDKMSLTEWEDRINDESNSHFKEYTGPVRLRELSKVCKRTSANQANNLVKLLGKF